MKTSKQAQSAIITFAILALLVVGGVFAVVHFRNNPGKCEAQDSPQQSTGKEQVTETAWCPSTWEPITVFTCLLAVATSGLWIFTAMLWMSTRKAVVDGEKSIAAAVSAADAANRHATEAAKIAESSRDQVNMTIQAIEYNERAWVSVNIRDHGHVGFYPVGSCDLFVTIFVYNTGKTPAINVHTEAWMFASHAECEKKLPALIDGAKRGDLKFSRMLLPQGEYEREYGVGLDGNEIKEGARSDGSFYPVVSVCTTYQTLPGMSQHQTVVNFSVSKRRDDKNFGGFLKIGQWTKKADLDISITTGGLAN